MIAKLIPSRANNYFKKRLKSNTQKYLSDMSDFRRVITIFLSSSKIIWGKKGKWAIKVNMCRIVWNENFLSIPICHLNIKNFLHHSLSFFAITFKTTFYTLSCVYIHFYDRSKGAHDKNKCLSLFALCSSTFSFFSTAMPEQLCGISFMCFVCQKIIIR
jgi:hypothetical protein